MTGPLWYGHGFLSMSSNWPPPPRGGPRGPLRSGAAAKASSETSACPDPRWFGGIGFFPFFPRFCFLAGALGLTLLPSAGALSLRLLGLSSKMAPTASSPAAKLVAASNNSLVLTGRLLASSCTRFLHVVPSRKALMTSTWVTLGSSVHCLEKRR